MQTILLQPGTWDEVFPDRKPTIDITDQMLAPLNAAMGGNLGIDLSRCIVLSSFSHGIK